MRFDQHRFRQSDRGLLRIFFPLACPVCDRSSGGLCTNCVTSFVRSTGTEPGFLAVYSYRGGVKKLVLASKGRRQHAFISWMADAIVERLRTAELHPGALVTFPPTTKQRNRDRGFDHGEILARAVAKRLGLRCARTLERVSGAQFGRGRAGRQNVEFEPLPAASRELRRVAQIVVVDDVCTTGATLRGVTQALQRCFDRPIVLVTFAAVE